MSTVKKKATAEKVPSAAADTGTEKSAETAAVEETTGAEVQKQVAACVYCGPSIKGISRQYTVYTGGIPDALAEFVAAHPIARRLIVPVERFAATRKRLETAGTPEAIIFKKLMSE